ncbi:MAG: JAB domain-containing protein [Holophagales bacterium]|nr:JAB domain-containing protein [Holophagales bacterium]
MNTTSLHTHPSGNLWPSQEDLRFTAEMSAAAPALGLELVGHLVVAPGGRWISIGQAIEAPSNRRG